MGKPGKAAKSGKSGKSDEATMKDPKLFTEKCYVDHAWCANFADTRLSKMTEDQLVKLNCGYKLVKLNEPCDQSRKDSFKKSCLKKLTKIDKTTIRNCIIKDIVTIAFQSCLYPQKGKKRAANLSGDASSSTAIWASVGVIVFLLICALLAWWYLKGDKKGAGRTAKGASKSVKSKMTTGKSKLGSRKSQVGSRKSLAGKSRAGSQRSKVSQASKGSAKKSRRSGKKK